MVATGKRCVRVGPDGGTPQMSSDRSTYLHFSTAGIVSMTPVRPDCNPAAEGRPRVVRQ